jgi:ribosome-associated protein
MPETLDVTARIRIPVAEFRYTFARSGGPGGQNVNKVSSKVTLHWPVRLSPSLPSDVRQRFCARFGSRINKQGELVLHSQRTRDQGRNIEDCLERLRTLLLEVAVAPKPRKATRPSRGSRERRLQTKRESSQRKHRRRGPVFEG